MKKHSKGPRRRANSPARERHPKGAEEGLKDRVKRYDNIKRELLMGKGETSASGGAKAENRKLRHRGPGEEMALHTTPTPCSTLETAGAPEEGHLAKPAWRQPPPEVEEAAEADRTARGGREATGPEEEEGPRPTPSSARGTHTETPLEAKTTECGTLPPSEPTGRPKDDKTHPEDGPEKTDPKSPTVGIPSLEIRS